MVVLKATSDKRPQMNLVVKVSWPDSDWDLKGKFLEKVIEEVSGNWTCRIYVFL